MEADSRERIAHMQSQRDMCIALAASSRDIQMRRLPRLEPRAPEPRLHALEFPAAMLASVDRDAPGSPDSSNTDGDT